jgi:hypothetical protein
VNRQPAELDNNRAWSVKCAILIVDSRLDVFSHTFRELGASEIELIAITLEIHRQRANFHNRIIEIVVRPDKRERNISVFAIH